MLAAIPDAVLSSPISFLFGVAVGFVLSNRYRIVKRNGSSSDGRAGAER
jgi:hypothetical protein